MSREEFRAKHRGPMALGPYDTLGGDTRKYGKVPVAGESRTRQADLDASDINKIVKRFERDGIMPLTSRQGLYVDVSEIGDYRSALEQVRKAEEYFMTLPAESRQMFGNDPAEFLDAVNEPLRVGELVKAGVIPPGEVVSPALDAGAAKEPSGKGSGD